MGLYKEECGHPVEWNLRVHFNSTVYTYCIGCIVEKLGLNNLEEYDCPFVKVNKTIKKTIKKSTNVEKNKE